LKLEIVVSKSRINVYTQIYCSTHFYMYPNINHLLSTQFLLESLHSKSTFVTLEPNIHAIYYI